MDPINTLPKDIMNVIFNKTIKGRRCIDKNTSKKYIEFVDLWKKRKLHARNTIQGIVVGNYNFLEDNIKRDNIYIKISPFEDNTHVDNVQKIEFVMQGEYFHHIILDLTIQGELHKSCTWIGDLEKSISIRKQQNEFAKVLQIFFFILFDLQDNVLKYKTLMAQINTELTKQRYMSSFPRYKKGTSKKTKNFQVILTHIVDDFIKPILFDLTQKQKTDWHFEAVNRMGMVSQTEKEHISKVFYTIVNNVFSGNVSSNVCKQAKTIDNVTLVF